MAYHDELFLRLRGEDAAIVKATELIPGDICYSILLASGLGPRIRWRVVRGPHRQASGINAPGVSEGYILVDLEKAPTEESEARANTLRAFHVTLDNLGAPADEWPCNRAVALVNTLRAEVARLERALASKIGPDWREALPYESALEMAAMLEHERAEMAAMLEHERAEHSAADAALADPTPEAPEVKGPTLAQRRVLGTMAIGLPLAYALATNNVGMVMRNELLKRGWIEDGGVGIGFRLTASGRKAAHE